jgi:hypothetical protein
MKVNTRYIKNTDRFAFHFNHGFGIGIISISYIGYSRVFSLSEFLENHNLVIYSFIIAYRSYLPISSMSNLIS